MEARGKTKADAKAAREAAALEAKELSKRKEREERACKTHDDFISLGKARGYHHGWADNRRGIARAGN